MLTKTDLNQIQEIVQAETKKVVVSETRKIVREETRTLVTEVGARQIIREETRDLVTEVGARQIVREELQPVRKDLKMTINFFDHEYLALNKRVKRVEEHLQLPVLS